MTNEKNNNEAKTVKYRSNHTPKGNAIFLDEDVKNEPIKVSIIKLELKKREMLRKYRETNYYKSGKERIESSNEDK